MTIAERIKAANDTLRLLPEWVKPNLLFHGGAIQPGHERLHGSKAKEQSK